MADEYSFEDEHFTPKFSNNLLYRGIKEVWIGDGNSETREEYNDNGYLYAKYQDDQIVRVGQTIAPETIEAAASARESAQDADNSASNAANSESDAASDAIRAAQSAQIAADYAGAASVSADASAGSSHIAGEMRYESEGYACGTQNGIDVDVYSPYYQNNAKYFYNMFVEHGSSGISVEKYDLYDYYSFDSYFLETPTPQQIIIYLVGPFLIGFVDLRMRDDVQGEISDTIQFYLNSNSLYCLDETRSVTIPIIAWIDWNARQEIGTATFTFSSNGSIIDLGISREAFPDSDGGTVSAYIRGSFILPLAENS